MVAREVGEHGSIEMHGLHAVLRQPMRGDFHRHACARRARKSGELALHGHRIRRGHFARHQLTAEGAAEGAQVRRRLDRRPSAPAPAARRRWSCRWCRSHPPRPAAAMAKRRTGPPAGSRCATSSGTCGEHDVRMHRRRLMHAIRFPDDGRRAAPRDIGREIQAMVARTATREKGAARANLHDCPASGP